MQGHYNYTWTQPRGLSPIHFCESCSVAQDESLYPEGLGAECRTFLHFFYSHKHATIETLDADKIMTPCDIIGVALFADKPC